MDDKDTTPTTASLDDAIADFMEDYHGCYFDPEGPFDEDKARVLIHMLLARVLSLESTK